MTTTTTASKFACTAKTPNAILLPCPGCKEAAARFAIHIGDMDAAAFFCLECETEFTFDEMRTMVNAWQKVLTRVAAMVTLLEEDLDGLDAAETTDAAE